MTRLQDVERLFAVIEPLLKDDPSAEASDDATDDESLESEGVLVARVVHMCRDPEDSDNLFTMLVNIRKHFGQGGVKRIQYTLVPLVFAALNLSQRVKALETSEEPPQLKFSSRKMFQFMHEIVSALASSGYPELALKLFLQCAIAADRCDYQAIAYEFISQVGIDKLSCKMVNFGSGIYFV